MATFRKALSSATALGGVASTGWKLWQRYGGRVMATVKEQQRNRRTSAPSTAVDLRQGGSEESRRIDRAAESPPAGEGAPTNGSESSDRLVEAITRDGGN